MMSLLGFDDDSTLQKSLVAQSQLTGHLGKIDTVADKSPPELQ